MNCDAVRKLLEEYALGALDEARQRQVEQHLDGCPDCRHLLTEYTEIVALLPLALATASPHRLPPTLKDRLLRQLDSSPTGVDEASLSATPSADGAPGTGAAGGGGRFWLWPPRDPRQWRWVAVAAMLLFVLMLAWTIHLNVVVARERALRAEFADLVGQQQELVLEVVDSRNTTRRILLPPAGDSRAYGKLFTRSDMVHVVAMAARLPPPPQGYAYHLWLTQEGETELAGALAVNRDGFGLLIYDAPTQDPNFQAAEVTLQRPGTTAPSGEPVLVWQNEE